MFKKTILLGAFLATVFLISACSNRADSASENEVSAPQAESPKDPLAEARKELFSEIGIEEGVPEKPEEGANLPPVLPSPPELPKIDAES